MLTVTIYNTMYIIRLTVLPAIIDAEVPIVDSSGEVQLQVYVCGEQTKNSFTQDLSFG